MKKFEEVYRKKESRYIRELKGTGTVYEHTGTGARVFTLKNEDRNKVFMIGFRTTPKDSTGVAHIMEHSVLCGSEKYPLKDPFVELAKGSLNTFLNAMTYPDKTVYPVASTNDKDFMNLMDVYLDAVFHPNIRKNPRIFRQEGWHYELPEPEGELTVNGVVYNEMKGVYSDPEAVLERCTLHALFPDTTYGFESGGDPEEIPELTPEAFLDFHDTYYHPSNSYIYLYGDLDMEEKLLWMDRQYLSAYERKNVDSRISTQQAFKKPVTETAMYGMEESEETEGRDYLSLSYVIREKLTGESDLAWQILEFMLISAPAAPLRSALIDAGLCEDVTGGYASSILQPYFSVVLRNSDSSRKQEFEAIVRETLEKLVRDGFEKKSLEAAVNNLEFRCREADYGRFPAGLSHGLTIMDTWLYDESPFALLGYEEALITLRRRIGEGWLEELLKNNILDNPHAAYVEVRPKKGLSEEKDTALKEKLALWKASLPEARRLRITEETKELKLYQETPDREEDIRTLPVLKTSDIDRVVEKLPVHEKEGFLHAPGEAGGIAYIRLLFDTAALDAVSLQKLSFLKELLGEMDTSLHSVADLTDELLLNTGSTGFNLILYPSEDGGFRTYLVAELSVLEEKIPEGLSLVAEMLKKTKFTDGKRLYDKLLEAKIRKYTGIEQSSHVRAAVRAGAYLMPDQNFADLTEGIAYYDFISEMAGKCGEKEELGAFGDTLAELTETFFTADNLTVYVYGSDRAADEVKENLPVLKTVLGSAGKQEKAPAIPAAGLLNEGIRTASMVNYAAAAGSFRQSGLPYVPELQVLRILLNYDYLWTNIRVKGGAYGCMSAFYRNGFSYLVSYRDPNLEKTYDVYEALPGYLENARITELDMTKYIIGTISGMDVPMTPSMKAAAALSRYMTGLKEEQLLKERNAILDCTPERLKSLSVYIKMLLEQHCRCTIGSARAVDEAARLFGTRREIRG